SRERLRAHRGHPRDASARRLRERNLGQAPRRLRREADGALRGRHQLRRDGQTIPIDVKFGIDQLNGIMMLVVTGVGFLIHLYASTYMAGDKGYARFFAYLNLFIFSMLVLILADNLPLLFVGWEGVGLCSYLLIGFWYESAPNAAAGKKAFLANRVGDFGL